MRLSGPLRRPTSEAQTRRVIPQQLNQARRKSEPFETAMACRGSQETVMDRRVQFQA
jgi:hypothetical protein